MIEDKATYDIALDLSEQQRFFATLDAQRQVHLTAIKRAIDDDYQLQRCGAPASPTRGRA